jgi:putative peptidoglycan lipid II flippase
LAESVKADPGHAARGRGLVRSTGIISALIFLSRLLGLVREQVFATLLGAGIYADAFQAAFRIPNLLRDLFAEGALSAAFVPMYTRALREGGPERAYRLANRLMTLLVVVLGALVVVAFIFAAPLVRTLAPGFDRVPGKTAITVQLTRVMLPFLPMVSFAAVAMGMLNAHQRYATPAFAPAVFNLVTIAWAAVLWAAGFSPAQVALGWAAGTLLGGAAQFGIQLPGLWKAGWRFRPEWAPSDPELRAILSLMAPATVGLAAVQVNIFVGTNFASAEEGAVAWLSYAFRILYVPIGIFGVAVGTVATTGLALRAAAGDMEGVRDTVRRALRFLCYLTLPATAGLMALGVPVVRLLFERGKFHAGDTQSTAAALMLYSTGLVAYTGVKVLAPAFYALGRPRVPLLASASAVATNILVILILHGRLGFRAIALGTALGSIMNATVLIAVFQSRIGGIVLELFSSAIARMVLAAAAMAPMAWYTARILEEWVGTRGLHAQLLTGLVPVVLGGGFYLGLTALLRVPEASELLALLGHLRGRLRRGQRL